ncbi:hypothetical protein HGRIS_002904 [Hohenbuehelia grisea]|uniref:Uncharacterized protein n=1 Tax=Hohenbuehelia grisea TaxID=104357 RepID=A0ABR3JNT9_9AGAR
MASTAQSIWCHLWSRLFRLVPLKKCSSAITWGPSSGTSSPPLVMVVRRSMCSVIPLFTPLYPNDPIARAVAPCPGQALNNGIRDGAMMIGARRNGSSLCQWYRLGGSASLGRPVASLLQATEGCAPMVP